MMDGDMRRERILKLLEDSKHPVSGSELAGQMGVSRQAVVQDIALLRAVNKNILSTNKGYILYDPDRGNEMFRRTLAVCHSDDETREELYTIVDYGGKVLDVVVDHDVYGQITVDLILKNRKDVDEFMDKLAHSKAAPLKTLTDGRHYHTVEADGERVLDAIEEKLIVRGFIKLDKLV